MTIIKIKIKVKVKIKIKIKTAWNQAFITFEEIISEIAQTELNVIKCYQIILLQAYVKLLKNTRMYL
jgi:hypothetical protein